MATVNSQRSLAAGIVLGVCLFTVLLVVRLSPSGYHAWNREDHVICGILNRHRGAARHTGPPHDSTRSRPCSEPAAHRVNLGQVIELGRLLRTALMAVATVWNLASPMASHVFGTRPSILREMVVTPGFDGETKDRRGGCQSPRCVTREGPQEACLRGPSRGCLESRPSRASHRRSRRMTRRKALRQRGLQNLLSGDWGGAVKRR